jgi:glycosyltransferase involved in cell wall biosynthesis
MAAVLESSPRAAVESKLMQSKEQPRRALRIGIMLRHWEQHGGVTVYGQQLTKALLQVESPHTFVLFYRNPALCGTFKEAKNAYEVALSAASILTWDQVAVRRAVRKHRIDVLFNPKYSIPLHAPCPTAWVCHGLDWYVMPNASPLRHRLAHRFLVPRYAAQTNAIISVSKLTSEHLVQYLRVPADRIDMIYPGVNTEFTRRFEPSQLAEVRERLALPPRYVVYSGAIYPPKNFRRLVQAYARVGPRLGVSLVIVGGENRYLSGDEVQEPERLRLGSWVRRLGWVDHESLPAIYAMADALLLPSTFEAVGLPVLEAMAAGCPVLTSNRSGPKEIAQDAAAFVDPESVESIAAGLERLLSDEQHRQTLISAGRARAAQFRWDTAAREVLDVLERIAPAAEE